MSLPHSPKATAKPQLLTCTVLGLGLVGQVETDRDMLGIGFDDVGTSAKNCRSSPVRFAMLDKETVGNVCLMDSILVGIM